MIPRYETEAMKAVWSLENQYQSWLKVELAACRAWAEEGIISREDLREIESKSGFDVDRILQIESEVHHDVIAFVSAVAERVGPAGRFIHLGLTSSDVVDTASALRLCQSLDVVGGALSELLSVVWNLAQEHKYTAQVGRSHGVHAEPITFGLKVLTWYSQLLRDKKRLEFARQEIGVGKVSGAVGTYAHCPPVIEERVCAELGLAADPISTQIVQRDRHSTLMFALAQLGATVERIATELRHLQRTEVLEALEPFGKNQKGSSAMPHKRNPILSERLCGMARMLRAFSTVAQENVALWHERDISHSSNERIMWPDGFHLAHYMVLTLKKVLAGLVVSPQTMERNLQLTGGLVYSQRVLLELVEQFGLRREDAYKAVQRNAMAVWEKKGHFLDLLAGDPLIEGKISRDQLAGLFTNDYYFRFVDDIFNRFEGPGALERKADCHG